MGAWLEVAMVVLGVVIWQASRPDAPLGPRRVEVARGAPATDAALRALIAEVRGQADQFVFLSGGASKMSAGHERQLLAMFDALALLAKGGRRLAVGDGGTAAGIMSAAGRARQASGDAFLLVGVAPAVEIPPRGTTAIEPHHSHVVAVDDPSATPGNGWGTETDTMYWLFEQLAAGRPSVTVVANGGGVTLKEVEANVRAGRPMVLVAGSGRAADAIVSLVQGAPAPAGEAADLRARAEQAGLAARPDLYTIVPLESGAAGLRDALARLLDRGPAAR